MTFFEKIKWTLGILMVFVLIISTNLIDRNNFIRVKDSVVSIYEDRLIANDLIFEMSKLVQKKEIAIVISDAGFYSQKNDGVNQDIQRLMSRYLETKLTAKENIVFGDFKENIQTLVLMESVFVETEMKEKEALLNHIFKIRENLDDLTKIQLEEGKRQMSISQKAVDTVELFTQIEIYFLVFLAVVIQVIVMYNPKKKKLK